MSEFDKIIGYDSIKEELKQLCDMIHNAADYEKLGAKMPKGLLLHGRPGIGKSLMAQSFAKESGRRSYTIRRNKPDGDFVNEIKNIFAEAAKNAPSIVLLDDMDKFVVEKDNNEEYVAVQACMDEVGFSDVYVIATANELYDIPDSLLRMGRFDRKIEVNSPKGEDAVKIIKHYMASKSVVGDLNIDDVAKMLYRRSCAEIESLLNEAAIYAGYERSEKISMEHIIRAVIRNEYGVYDSFSAADALYLEDIAYHEAGHVVVGEILNPNGTGFVSICAGGRNGEGFVVRCATWEKRSHHILMLLAGKAATELKYGKVAEGAADDLNHVIQKVKADVTIKGRYGIGALTTLDLFDGGSSDLLRAKQEAIIQNEIERYLFQAKKILAENRSFLDAVATALLEKGTLLHSDIQELANLAIKEIL